MIKNSIIVGIAFQVLMSTLPSVEARYNPDEALRAVYYSAVSYCLITDIMKWDCGRPCDSTDRIRPDQIF